VLFDKALKPGGVYFMEDLEVSRVKRWLDPEPEGIVMVSCTPPASTHNGLLCKVTASAYTVEEIQF
jgi:hypothetical protein